MAFTYFFRDRQTLDLIAECVIPALKRHMYIHIWDAGCAMGPEPYSLAIVLRENMGPFLFRNARILATDIDESGDFGETIRRGVYGERGVERIPAELLERYFTRLAEPGPHGEPRHQIAPELRKAVEYQQHDLLTLRPPRDGFGLIVCKNVLLHFTPEERVAVIKMFHAALAPGGFLVTEQTQKLPAGLGGMFEQVSSAGQVWRKIGNLECRIGNVESSIRNTDYAIRNIMTHEALRIQQDHAFSRVSDYTWFNLDAGGQRVGKVRVRIDSGTLTVYSLSIFPEFQGQGFAQQAIAAFQNQYAAIVADRVRPEAGGFWEKMRFTTDYLGNYTWQR